MGKYEAARRLSKKQIDDLFIDFARALACIRSPVEAANLIKDLLTEQEVVILGRRLQIARFLYYGNTYGQIHRMMRVGNSTIAKVHAWMDLYGEGLKLVIKRTKKHSHESKDLDALSWSRHKKKYPMYYWPELILKQIVNSAKRSEKQKLLKLVTQLRHKTKIARELMVLLQPSQNSHTPVYGRFKSG